MIYVDAVVRTKPSDEWPYKSMSHLTADSLIELQVSANKLQLSYKYWECFDGTHYYAITAGKRQRAIEELQAKKVSHSDCLACLAWDTFVAHNGNTSNTDKEVDNA